MRLEARNLAAGYNGHFTIEGVDLVIEERRITALIGPNGAGKSTLLKALSRALKPMRGVVLLDGEVLHRLPGRDVARKLALVSSDNEGALDLSVEELVYRGRFPHQSLFKRDPGEDTASVEWALGAMQLQALRSRRLAQLSSGELRRAWLAMALAQRPSILLLDEPTTFLDVAHQFELLDLLADLKSHGVTVVMAMHDLWLTALYCDRVVAMEGGRVVACGPASEVLTPELISSVFGVKVEMREHPTTGANIPIPCGRAPEEPDAAPVSIEGPAIAPPNPENLPSPH